MYVRPFSCNSCLAATHLAHICGSAWFPSHNSKAQTHFEVRSSSIGTPIQNPTHFSTTMSVTSVTSLIHIMMLCLFVISEAPLY